MNPIGEQDTPQQEIDPSGDNVNQDSSFSDGSDGSDHDGRRPRPPPPRKFIKM